MPKKGQKGGKGGRKKKVDAFEKKDWFKLKIPTLFPIRHYGWTPANKTRQGVIVENRLKDRIVTIRCADLDTEPIRDQSGEIKTQMNLKLRIADTRDKECYLDFHGMELTRDKTCSLLKKKATLVEASTDIKTAEGFVFRVFAFAMTKRGISQVKETAYAKTSQVKNMRAKMIAVMQNKLNNISTKEFVRKLIAGITNGELVPAVQNIFPVEEPVIRKVKLMKRPKDNAQLLNELHSTDIDARSDDEE